LFPGSRAEAFLFGVEENKKANLSVGLAFFLHSAVLPVPQEEIWRANLDIFFLNFLLCYFPVFSGKTPL